jgi:hypothetical protein
MKPFIIVGHPLDLHGSYVAWALGTAGYATTFINSTHDSAPTRTTLWIENDNDDFVSAEWRDAEAVWCRRLFWVPVLDKSDGLDDEFTFVQERLFSKWLFELLERCSVRCINPPTAAQAAENKFIQLKVARSHGISIPRTLITARPDRFRAFLESEKVIVAKPLDAFTWKLESGGKLSAFASLLDVERGSQLSDGDIAQCVTVYQQRIEKVADVRMVVMGADVFAFRVIQEGEQHLDYRIGFFQENHLKYEAIPVPASLKKKMIDLMGSLRITFTSADFALKADGEWVFLDLNPAGQWLFVEAGCPDARLGQRFCSFFVNGRVDATGESLFPSFAQYMESDAVRPLKEAVSHLSAA